MSFFAVDDINIHQLNLGPIRGLKIMLENSFRKMRFFALFEQ
jgi:hypothetical protein